MGFLEKTIAEAKAAIPDRLIEARELTKIMFIHLISHKKNLFELRSLKYWYDISVVKSHLV
jgi:hypothetical protein